MHSAIQHGMHTVGMPLLLRYELHRLRGAAFDCSPPSKSLDDLMLASTVTFDAFANQRKPGHLVSIMGVRLA